MPKFPVADLLIGFDTCDDACVYKLSDELAMIQTVDFFPPIVDDPYLFGQIAAANALSDIYAMGAEPSLALNILCFPECLPREVLSAIMQGGHDKVGEAGAVIAGGHSIDDPVPKYGLCVSGFIHPAKIWSNATAKEGDLLVLTKPMGSGITTTAAKADMISEEQFRHSADTMSTLNKYARDVAAKMGINACTDITGFGLLGHASEMAVASSKTIEIYADKLPLLEGAEELAKMGIIPGGAYKNRDYLKGKLDIETSVPLHLTDILFDPQTSGGLLLSVSEKDAKVLLSRLSEVAPFARIVGQVLPQRELTIYVK